MYDYNILNVNFGIEILYIEFFEFYKVVVISSLFIYLLVIWIFNDICIILVCRYDVDCKLYVNFWFYKCCVKCLYIYI